MKGKVQRHVHENSAPNENPSRGAMRICVTLCHSCRILDGQMMDVSLTGIEITPGMETCFCALTPEIM